MALMSAESAVITQDTDGDNDDSAAAAEQVTLAGRRAIAVKLANLKMLRGRNYSKQYAC